MLHLDVFIAIDDLIDLSLIFDLNRATFLRLNVIISVLYLILLIIDSITVLFFRLDLLIFWNL